MKTKLFIIAALTLCSIHLNAQTAEEYFIKGTSKALSEKYRRAIAEYTKAIEINPLFAEAFFGRGAAKHSLGDYPGAIADFTNAIEITLNNWGAKWMQPDGTSYDGWWWYDFFTTSTLTQIVD